MSRNKWSKITPNKLFNDYFADKHHDLSKRVVHWSVSGYMELEIWIDDGAVYSYDAMTDSLNLIRQREVNNNGKYEKNHRKSN